MAIENTIIYLLGYPGTGKYTIGKEICRQHPEFRLVDNHLINNPVFSLIHTDGKTKLPSRIWDNVRSIWDAVLDTMINISPSHYSFVLTNALFKTDKEMEWYEEVKGMAEARDALFIPVILKISLEEHKNRITHPDRKKRMKETDPSSPDRYASEDNIFIPVHPNLLVIDVSSISPDASTKAIIDHVAHLKGVE